MADLGDLFNVIGTQRALGNIQDNYGSGSDFAVQNPELAKIADTDPRTFQAMLPKIADRLLQQSALQKYGDIMNGNSIDPNAPAPPSALQQYGDGSTIPSAPQPLPGTLPISMQQPTQQIAPNANGRTAQLLPLIPSLPPKMQENLMGLAQGVPMNAGPAPAGETYQNGKLVPIPGAAQAAAQQKESETEATTTGTNLAEARKTLAVMQSNLPALNARLNEMKTFALGDPAQGIAPASYGSEHLIDQNGEGILADYHNTMKDPTSVSNTMLRQRAAQGVLPELGPQLAQAGIKGNKFLEQIASSASGINMNDAPAAKAAAIEGLRTQYMRNLQATQNQVAQLSGQPMPQQAIDTPAIANQTAPDQQASPQMPTPEMAKAILARRRANK